VDKKRDDGARGDGFYERGGEGSLRRALSKVPTGVKTCNINQLQGKEGSAPQRVPKPVEVQRAGDKCFSDEGNILGNRLKTARITDFEKWGGRDKLPAKEWGRRET